MFNNLPFFPGVDLNNSGAPALQTMLARMRSRSPQQYDEYMRQSQPSVPPPVAQPPADGTEALMGEYRKMTGDAASRLGVQGLPAGANAAQQALGFGGELAGLYRSQMPEQRPWPRVLMQYGGQQPYMEDVLTLREPEIPAWRAWYDAERNRAAGRYGNQVAGEAFMRGLPAQINATGNLAAQQAQFSPEAQQGRFVDDYAKDLIMKRGVPAHLAYQDATGAWNLRQQAMGGAPGSVGGQPSPGAAVSMLPSRVSEFAEGSFKEPKRLDPSALATILASPEFGPNPDLNPLAQSLIQMHGTGMDSLTGQLESALLDRLRYYRGSPYENTGPLAVGPLTVEPTFTDQRVKSFINLNPFGPPKTVKRWTGDTIRSPSGRTLQAGDSSLPLATDQAEADKRRAEAERLSLLLDTLYRMQMQ